MRGDPGRRELKQERPGRGERPPGRERSEEPVATIALTLPQYNEAVVRTALADHRRVIQTPERPPEFLPYREIPGRRSGSLADPHKHWRSEGGLDDGRTLTEARRGGRPRLHASRRQAQAAAARAYRARLRARLAP